ncbi:HD domain-containing protein [Geomonas sp. Red32]|uniref:HD domain-containing protein n=1 Tax=Geomonas sp. Red32 TaxID=2912856 RepID=UPI00202CCC72|nr:HD domain-containing protein [Geomonas sp. Red32]MCM0082639.1 HD domain-containing protein [Geomonas sp. Red32]
MHDRLLMVGGMVRDRLLGVPSQDVDLIAIASPDELLAAGFRLVEAKSSPNIFFRFHNDLGKVEITRLDSHDDLAMDLSRRDFTANAIAMTLQGAIEDPLGGRDDIKKKRLRLCSPASFSDDPTRIFRAFRFECEGWRLDAEAEAAISSRPWSDALSRLPMERFSQEMLKALSKQSPSRFFRRMLELKVGGNLLPEIFTMPQVPAGPLQHHPEGDLFEHSMLTLERMSALTPDVKARFCALFHDLGKLATDQELYPKHHGHEEAGADAATQFCTRLRLPSSLQRGLRAACALHGKANRWDELRDSTKIKLALGAIKGGIEEFLPLLVESDFKVGMKGWEETLKVAAMNAAQLGIDPAVLSEPGLPPEKVQQMIMQRRVEVLREVGKGKSKSPLSPL